MNIQNMGNIPNITIQITTGTPQAGFRCDPRAVVASDCFTWTSPTARATGRTTPSGMRRRACGRKRILISTSSTPPAFSGCRTVCGRAPTP